jgi:glycosyltransferase involved in cell wall biosynthesis
VSAPLVSIIVRSMGREGLPRALGCVAAQTHRPIEAVVVDAAASGLQPSAPQGLPVTVVRGGPFDRPRAANAGLDAARGEWLAFLDEDDEIDPGHVAHLLATSLVAGTRAAYSQTRLLDAAGTTLRVLGGPFNRNILLRTNYITIHAMLFHRSLLAGGARFDEALETFEDWDFWLQLSKAAPFAFSGQPTASYRATVGTSGAGAGPNLDRQRALAQRDRIMAKWGTPSA